MRDPSPVDVLVIGGSLQGLLILERLVSHGYSCLLVTASELGDGQTLHSHGVLNTGFGMAGPEPVNLLRQIVLPDLARRGVRTYGTWGAIAPGLPPGAQGLASPDGLELGGGALVRLPERNVDKVDLVSALGRGAENHILRANVSGITRSADGRVLTVELEPSGVVVAPRTVVVAAGTGSKKLLRRLGAEEGQIKGIKHRPVQVLCVRGPSGVLPALDVVSPADQLFVASHERAGERIYLATPVQFLAPHHEDLPEDASAELDQALVDRGWEVLFRLFPPLGSLAGLRFAAYAGYRQDGGDQPGVPRCEQVESAPNVIAALPGGLLGAWPVMMQATGLVEELTGGRSSGPGPRLEAGGRVDIGQSYEDSSRVTWTSVPRPGRDIAGAVTADQS
ncbi:MAG TPA: FAD-dependent oxidoreductase [Candidatus Dormibacteraeota bacterium]